jgi:hypothetical protein
MYNRISSDFERVASCENCGLDQFGTGKMQSVRHDKWTFDSAGLKQVGVVAHFSELHKHIHDAEEIRID